MLLASLSRRIGQMGFHACRTSSISQSTREKWQWPEIPEPRLVRVARSPSAAGPGDVSALESLALPAWPGQRAGFDGLSR